LTIGDAHLKELESLVLRIIKPKGNKLKGKFLRAENLRRRFADEIQQTQKSELISMMGKIISTKEIIPRKIAGKKAALARYISGPMKLRANYKGSVITAQVRRDGTIRFDGKKYFSPSVAGARACERRSCNGWTFWKYERAPGDWVLLDNLRR
jgi:hypothetical protein